MEPIESFGYDSYVRSQTRPSKIGNAEGTSRVRALKRATSIGMSKGSTRHAPYAVMDTGAEREVVGGVGWKILHFSDKSEPLHGGLNGMGSGNIPFVDAVTAVEDTDERVVLIEVGDAGYDRRTIQRHPWRKLHLSRYDVQRGRSKNINSRYLMMK